MEDGGSLNSSFSDDDKKIRKKGKTLIFITLHSLHLPVPSFHILLYYLTKTLLKQKTLQTFVRNV